MQPEASADTKARKRAMEALARATRAELAQAFEAMPQRPQIEDVRGPEVGLVMVRGRIGGAGAPFNLGETTVARSTVRLASGTVGHGHVMGTDKTRARLCATFDALWQDQDTRASVEGFVARLESREADEDGKAAREAAATRVEFFTMVRGEDE
jgi:alpha-D-ribose 1-methylphosphonate 5-triphosphate synthase subunit PhnG